MTTAKQFLAGIACFLALGIQAATYDFTSGTSSTNGWQQYAPLASLGSTATFTDSGTGYRLASAPSASPGTLGPARVGSFLPGNFSDFSLTLDLPSYSATPSEFFGAGARFQTIGLGTSSGYVMGYDNSSGDLEILKVVNEASQGALGASASHAVALSAGQGYRFTFDGVGSMFNGAVYSLNNLSTPLATVSGSDATFASGEVGMLVDSVVATGAADVTFSAFTVVVPEPGVAALLALAGLTLWAVRPRQR